MKILILGGYGLAGRRLAPLLLKETQVELVLGGRNLQKAQEFASQLNQEYACTRVAATVVDAAQPESLNAAFSKVNFVIVAVGAVAHTQSIVQAALKAGIDYLDIQYAQNKVPILQALAPDILKANRCVITEAGFHPGLIAALIRFAAPNFDTLEDDGTPGRTRTFIQGHGTHGY